MRDKEIIDKLTKKLLLLESYKRESMAIKKLVNAINRQRKQLSEFLDTKEMKILAEAAEVLSPFSKYFDVAGKQRNQAINESLAAADKRDTERFETVSKQYFDNITLEEVIIECQDLAAYVWETTCVSYRLTSSVKSYTNLPTPENLHQMKLDAAQVIDEMSRHSLSRVNKHTFEDFKEKRRKERAEQALLNSFADDPKIAVMKKHKPNKK